MRHYWNLGPILCLLGCNPLPLATHNSPIIEQEAESTAGDKGLPISASAPSFMPHHLTGDHAGRTACPLCVHGMVPQVQIWTQEDQLADGIALANQADQMCADWKPQANAAHKPVAYVILVPKTSGKVSSATETAVKDAGLKHVFFVQVPSWEDAQTSRIYGHSNSDRPGVRVYSVVNRRVFKRWDSPRANQWPEIAKSVVDSQKYVSHHEITDSQIAPEWEPGQRLEVEFRVVDGQNRPMSGIKVSASQTDATGHYNPAGWNRREPRLAALAWTDKEGKITFRTIMPGPYPAAAEPAHIHFSAVIEGKQNYRTLWFEGDPLLSKERRDWADKDEETIVIPLSRTSQPMKASHTFVINR